MNRTIQRLFAILLILASMGWIYSNYFKGKQQVIKNVSQNQSVEIPMQEKQIEIISQNQVLDMESNDAEKTENHTLNIRQTPESSHKKGEKGLEEEQKYLEEFKQMLKGSKLSADIEFEDDFLNSYLISDNYEINKAFSKIQNCLKLRENHPYFFQNINFDFSQNSFYRFATLLPHERKDGSATMLFQLGKWNPDDVPFEHLKQILFMIIIQEMRNPVTQVGGFNVIYDFQNAGFQYVKYGTLQNLQLISHVTQEVLPLKLVGIHFINLNIFGRILIALISPFLYESTVNLFHIHSSVEELLDFFPQSMLLIQYGGTLTDYYSGDWIKKANVQHSNFPAGGQKNELLI